MQRNCWSIGFFILLGGLSVPPGGIARFHGGFTPEKIARREKHMVAFSDHVPDKSVTMCLDSEGLPVAVSRTVMTEVCKKGECLPVYLKLFWTVSGAYLGFAMEPGEVLTKYDHALFDAQDYDRLHLLLGDPLSPLANVEERDIVPGAPSVGKQDEQADVTTGATKKDIAPYTVGGAAYTTYALWHLVYGETKDSIQVVFRNYLTPGLKLSFLRNSSVRDKMWALSVIDFQDLRSPELMEEIAKNYRNGEGYLRDGILSALLQKEYAGFVQANYLVSLFGMSGFAQKRAILKKLEESPELARDCIPRLVESLAEPAPQLVVMVLRVVRKSVVKDLQVKKWVEIQAVSEDADVSLAAMECIAYLDTH